MFKQVFWQLLLKLITIISNLSVGIYVINYLGPESQGQIAYAISLTTVLGFLTTFGLGTFIAKTVATTTTSRLLVKRLDDIFSIRVIGSIFFIILLTVIYTVQNKYDQLLLLAFIAFSKVVFSLNVYQDFFEGTGKVGLSAKFEIVNLLIISTIRVALVLYGHSVELIAFTYLLEQIIRSAFSLFTFGKSTKHNYKIRPTLSTLVLAKKVSPLILSTVVVGLFTQMDILLIDHYFGSQEVGVYSAAMKVVTPFYFVGTLIISVYFSKLSFSYNHDYRAFISLFRKLVCSLLILSTVIIFSIYLLGEKVFFIIFSDEYSSGFEISLILVFAIPFVYLGPLTGRYLILIGDFKCELEKTATAALFNVLLGVVFIPIYGLVAAAATTVFSYFIANFIYLFFKPVHRDFLMEVIKGNNRAQDD
ncbi:flippase [Vibrio superstes]|uniref:O-unit flippase Wzx n=1 Tax=Vibrio superstes NBRC 103154 TaxID=1219062 RepID=A0A511QTX0_9VIBR|nr:flippase [Vibrio superstes]GEM80809.1 O-unit flippase Wzx [Vibrio superstes NBRC 103154]